MTPRSVLRRRRILTLSALAVLVLVGASCGGDDGGGDEDGGAAATTTEVAPVDDDGADESPSELVEEGLEIDLPRTLTYAGVEIDLVAATASNATPATFGDDAPEVDDVTRLYLEVATAYAAGFPGSQGVFPVGDFSLVTDDGSRIAAAGLGISGEVPVAAAGETRTVLVFEVEPADLDGAVLTYDNGENVPASVPIEGPVPDAVYPIRTEVGEAAVPNLRTGCEPAPADVVLTALTWGVDGGVDAAGERLLAGRTSRAAVDHRLLTVDLGVTARVGACGGTYANHQQVVLEVDGEAMAPINSYSVTLADGDAAELIFVFEVPVDAGELTLVVGAEGGTHGFGVPTPVPDDAP